MHVLNAIDGFVTDRVFGPAAKSARTRLGMSSYSMAGVLNDMAVVCLFAAAYVLLRHARTAGGWLEVAFVPLFAYSLFCYGKAYSRLDTSKLLGLPPNPAALRDSGTPTSRVLLLALLAAGVFPSLPMALKAMPHPSAVVTIILLAMVFLMTAATYFAADGKRFQDEDRSGQREPVENAVFPGRPS